MSYSSFLAQGSMALDCYRNRVYTEAIKAAVTPESVVLDIGAGIGVLGLIAASAGAKRVYLIEPEPVVRLACALAKQNGLADKIIILEGKAEDITLPERVDVILSVLTGNLLFSEDFIHLLYVARDKYLKPGGQLIPDQAQLMLAPVTASKHYAKYIEPWSQPVEGLDFSPGRVFAINEISHIDRNLEDIQLLGKGVVVEHLDLATSNQLDCDNSVNLQIRTEGKCHGLVGWIQIRLGNCWLSSDVNSPEVHWTPQFFSIYPPIHLKLEEVIEVGLNRPYRGEWTWTLKSSGSTTKNSTFFSKIKILDDLKTVNPTAANTLNHRGNEALKILSLINAGYSNQAISQKLIELFPTQFDSLEEALNTVQSFARHYASPTSPPR